jgi:coenzyme F420-reducing hydrogenase delta subunit
VNTKFEPEIIFFCCNYCSYAAADLAGSLRMNYPPNIKIIIVPCSGRVDIIHLLHAFEQGADGVFVTGCMEGDCHFINGNIRAKKRVNYAKKILGEIGIEQDRVGMYNISASDAPEFVKVAKLITEKITALGPSPLKKQGDH